MVATAVVSFVVAALTVPMVLPFLRRRSMWDLPNERSSHVLPTPRGGGIAVVLAFGAGLIRIVITDSAVLAPSLVIVIGCWAAAAAVGMCDDVRNLSARSRLAAQVLISLVVVASATASSATVPRLLVVPVAFITVIAYINVFNFMDGVNGISGLHAALGTGYYAWLAMDTDATTLALVAASVCGASLGFLPWNFPRAQTFLGDVGSYFLGACLGSLAVLLWLAGSRADLVIAPLTIYLADTGWTLVGRARSGRSLFQAHREHAYQRFSDVIGHTGATTVSVAASSLCVVIAVACRPVGPVVTAIAMTAVAAVYLVASRVVTRRMTAR